MSRPEGVTLSRNWAPAGVSCVAAMTPQPCGDASEHETIGEVVMRRSAVIMGSSERRRSISSNKSTLKSPPRKPFGSPFESSWKRHWNVR